MESKLTPSNVNFYPLTHTYVNPKNGKVITGLTTLLAKHGITKDISNIPKHILENAAKRGTEVHQQIEDYDNNGTMPTEKWAIPYLSLNLNTIASEFLVSYKDIVATQIDKILDDYSVCDIKTSREVDVIGVTWQCSIGAYILEKQCNVKVPKLYCIHLRDEKVNMFELERIPNEQIESLFECELNGIIYQKSATELTIQAPIELYQKTKVLFSAIKKLEEKKKELENNILNYMIVNDISKITSDSITFSVVKASEVITFDKSKLMNDYPDIDYSKYNKKSKKKEYLKVTIK